MGVCGFGFPVIHAPHSHHGGQPAAGFARVFGLCFVGYICVPSSNLKPKKYSAPIASAIFSMSSLENLPVFMRWLNACGLVPIARASSDSDMLLYASAILIFCGTVMRSSPSNTDYKEKSCLSQEKSSKNKEKTSIKVLTN